MHRLIDWVAILAFAAACQARGGPDATVPPVAHDASTPTALPDVKQGTSRPDRAAVDATFAGLSGKSDEARLAALAGLLAHVNLPTDRAGKDVWDYAIDRLHDYFGKTKDALVLRALDQDLDGGSFTCGMYDAPGPDDDECDEIPDGGRTLAINHEYDGGYCKVFVRYRHRECVVHIAEHWDHFGGRAYGDGSGRFAYGESRDFCGEKFTCQCRPGDAGVSPPP